MTSQILERIYLTRDNNDIVEVKKLIKSPIFLKSVVICASEMQFIVNAEKEMQVDSMMDFID